MNIFFNKIIIIAAKVAVAPLIFTLSLAGYTFPSKNIVVQPTQIDQTTKTIQRPVDNSVTTSSKHEKEGGNLNQNLGLFNPTGGTTYFLQGGINTTATSVYMTSFREPVSNVAYTMTNLNSNIEYATLDPQIPARREYISFTGITQNSDGTAVLTGVTRGLLGSYPYTASTTIARTHAAQSQLILGDSPQLFSEYAVKQNDETVTGSWSFPTPTSPSNPATMSYVLAQANGSTTVDRLVVAGTAGETVATNSLMYFSTSTARWLKANAATSSNFVQVFIGVSQGNGVNGGNIAGGVLLSGIDRTRSNLTAGTIYYLSATTTGTISTVASNVIVGHARSATELYFDPYTFNQPYLKAANTFTATTTLATTTIQGKNPFLLNTQVYVATTTGQSFSVPNGVSRIWIRAVGGGGGGGAGGGAGQAAGGGGAGGYSEKWCDVSATTSINVTVGQGGLGAITGGPTGTTGGDGATTTVGTCLVAGGGGGGAPSSANTALGGQGGRSSLGDLNVQGSFGGYSVYTPTAKVTGYGGSSLLGAGALGRTTEGNGSDAATSTHGFGGGGAGGLDTTVTTSGGAGANGVVIINW